MEELQQLLSTLEKKEKNYEAGKFHCNIVYSLEQHASVIDLVKEKIREMKEEVAY